MRLKGYVCIVACVLFVFSASSNALDETTSDGDQLSDLDMKLLRSCQESYNELKIAKDELASQFDLCEKSLESIKSEKDLITQELSILEERLQVCDATSKAHKSRETICKQDLEMRKDEIKSAARRMEELEKEVRVSDCKGIKNDLKVYRIRAEEAEIEKEIFRRKLKDADARCKGLPDLEDKLKDIEKESLECSIDKKVLSAELKATKDALDVMAVSLAAHEKYDALQRAHEQELLPHWLVYTASSILSTSTSAVQHVVHTVSPICTTIVSRWNSMMSIIPGWEYSQNQVKKVFYSKYAVAIRNSIHRIVNSCIRHAMHAEDRVEDLILQQVHRIDSSRRSPFSKKETAHYIVWSMLVSACIPIGYIVLSSLKRKVEFFIMPGSATVDINKVNDKDVLTMIEQKMGYTFKDQDDIKMAVLDVEKKGRMSGLGEHVVRLIIAQHAYDQAADSSVVDGRYSTAAVKNAACTAGLDVFIKQGPGAHSGRAADAKRADVLYAIIAMIYLKSNGSLESVKNVWKKVVA